MDILWPFSNSRMVSSLRSDLAPSLTQDQFSSARAARDCSAVRFRKTTLHSTDFPAEQRTGPKVPTTCHRLLMERKTAATLPICKRGRLALNGRSQQDRPAGDIAGKWSGLQICVT